MDGGTTARAGRDAAPGADHPVPGNGGRSRLVQCPQGPTHGASPAGDAQESGDLAVGGDLPRRDLLDKGVDPLEEARLRSRWGQVSGQACGGVRS